MSISRQDRIKKEKELLSKIAADINDDVRAKDLKFDQGNYPGYSRSIWLSLFRKNFLRHTGEKDLAIFFLDPKGWLKGIQINGELKKDSEFTSGLKRVCSTVRKISKDQNSENIRTLAEIAAEAKVREEWLANVIDSQSIEYRFNRVGIVWQNEMSNSVCIPSDFGSSRTA